VSLLCVRCAGAGASKRRGHEHNCANLRAGVAAPRETRRLAREREQSAASTHQEDPTVGKRKDAHESVRCTRLLREAGVAIAVREQRRLVFDSVDDGGMAACAKRMCSTGLS
jgi:hypothetical protein